MTKMQLVLLSMVTAIPAGVLGFLLVLSFMNSFESMGTMFQVLAGLTFLCCLVLVFIPFMAMFGKTATPAAASGSSGSGDALTVDDSGVFQEEFPNEEFGSSDSYDGVDLSSDANPADFDSGEFAADEFDQEALGKPEEDFSDWDDEEELR